MAITTGLSGRRYPIILEFYRDYPVGPSERINSQVIQNDLEFEKYIRMAAINNFTVKEVKTDELLRFEKEEAEEKAAIALLTKRKLILDVKTGERVYKTYFVTQGVAWFAGIVAVLLGYLKIAELFKFWPYHK